MNLSNWLANQEKIIKNNNLKNKMTEKNQALEKALALLKKNFGEGACNYFTSMPKQKIEVVSSGSLTLDIALGIGGFARGRIAPLRNSNFCFNLLRHKKFLNARSIEYAYLQKFFIS
jgi:hypothetical protein